MLIDVELVHMILNLLHVYDCDLPLYVTFSVSCYIVGALVIRANPLEKLTISLS